MYNLNNDSAFNSEDFKGFITQTKTEKYIPNKNMNIAKVKNNDKMILKRLIALEKKHHQLKRDIINFCVIFIVFMVLLKNDKISV